MRDLLKYLLAVGRHWKILLGGGSVLVVAVAGYGLATGSPIPQPVGFTIVGLTLVIASFLAWRTEYRARLLAESEPSVQVRITGIVVPEGPMEGYSMVVHALLSNTAKEPRGVRWDGWTLDVLDAGGQQVGRTYGHLKGEIKPLGPEDQFSVEFLFPPITAAMNTNVRIRLSGADLHGQPIHAEIAPMTVESSESRVPLEDGSSRRIEAGHLDTQLKDRMHDADDVVGDHLEE